MTEKLGCLDLFCGCGGLSLGFKRAGFRVLAGIDAWQDAINTFNRNHNGSVGIRADLSTLDPAEIAARLGGDKIDVIVGGPPCQGFSIAGRRIVDDERNKLYKSFVRFVDFFRPKAFLLENVPNILSMGGGIIRDAIIKDFSALGYTVVHKVLLASDYGVPQNRRRAVFVGLRGGHQFLFPASTVAEKVTAKDAISDLPEETLPDGVGYPTEPQSDFQRLMRKNSKDVHNHAATVHNPRTVEIIAQVPDGGNYRDLPVELQNTRRVHIAWTRLDSKRPSFTIDCGHRHHFHYKFNRIPTVRESARIQSFPDDFIFLGSRTSQYKQTGNAVPVLLAEALAQSLKEAVDAL